MTELGSNQASDVLLARIETLLRDNHALSRSLESEKEENSRLLAAVARTEGENAVLREAVEPARVLNEAVSTLPAAIANQSGRIDAVADGLTQLITMLVQHSPAERLFLRGGGEANEAAERLHAILISRSWRVTRPMRGVGRLIARLKR